jgi:hypothetical protein
MTAHVPYRLHIDKEKYCHSLLPVWFYFLGFMPLGELPTNIGRIGMVWKMPDMTVIAEVKYSADKPLDTLPDKPTKQIHDRKCYETCLAGTGKIILVSIAFSGREVGCHIEIP